MAIETTYTNARANFARLCNQVSRDRDIVLIKRRNAEDVALIASSELSGLLETAHLLRSPKNAQRLLSALNRALNRSGVRMNSKGAGETPPLRKGDGFLFGVALAASLLL